MSVRKPTVGELERIACSYGLDLSHAELESFRALLDGPLASYARIDQLEQPAVPVDHPRTPGYRPSAAENPFNAWYWRCSIRGSDHGRLAGKRIAVKDNICVAGVPMMNGSAVLEGYVPDEDATVVSRILAEGGEIAGKAVCEHLCFSGGSHTSDTGPVQNPRRPGYSAGGSSSGSAALVAAGEVDLALGGDQGGSIRIPSSWCGVTGLKPTYGLVPYTGVFPIELTLDHVGPIARTVADTALFLDVLAGSDHLDPRQPEIVPAQSYLDLGAGIEGLRVGVLEEGFGWPGASEEDVDELVRRSAADLATAGAEVRTISVPEHRDGIHLWNAIAIEGATSLMLRGNGMGTNWKGHYTTGLLDFFGRSRVARANDFSITVKLVLLLGEYMHDRYQGRYYAKAQNIARTLRGAYDAALADVDVLVLPTLPMKATKLPGTDATDAELVARALEMLINTCPFDITGHPALTVPCGSSDGLPVGMMMVGRRWDDLTVLKAGHAVEQALQV